MFAFRGSDGRDGMGVCLDGILMLSVAILLGGLVGCESGGGDTTGSKRNEAAGQPCHINETAFQCAPASRSCYGAGEGSSCPGGGLCAGDGNGMTCAYSCSQDSDCAGDTSATVCMQGCKAAILNGYCVSPALQTDFLEDICPTLSAGSTGVVGVSNY